MTSKNLLATAVIGVGLIVSASAWAAEEKGEKVDMKSLPPAVQKTINEKAAGGEVVRVMREDDSNGKWNYEALVKKDGKEWAFEVAPSGKFVRNHEKKS